MDEKKVKKIVREGYAEVARSNSSCCGPASSCCGPTNVNETLAKKIGYSDDDLKAVPEGANLGLGCGNPVALATLKQGEMVLDLGSGAGFDCFLAANKVGPGGQVIGVDMTPEMIDKARENAQKGDYKNVEFRLGEIEHLPAADNSIDAIISNCVINLSPAKDKVFSDAYRVLKPGGRLMISDIVLLKELPEAVRNSAEAYIGCLSGAILKEEYLGTMKAAGFKDPEIMKETAVPADLWFNDSFAQEMIEKLGVELSPAEIRNAAESVVSVQIYAVK
jgi:arsenite methyltransferase